ncbi:hypothetical protein ACA910_006181 [Epithemia clementina (nom. ined.)]
MALTGVVPFFIPQKRALSATDGGRSCSIDLISALYQRSQGEFFSPHHFQSSLSSQRHPLLSSSSCTSILKNWSLSPFRRIHSLDRCVESLDVHPSQSSRYLLTGSRDGILSVYDLSSSGAEKPVLLSSQLLQQRQREQEGQRYNYISPHSKQHQSHQTTLVHKPVARSNATPVFLENESNRVRLGAVIGARWYPIDTGAFVSAHTTGSIVIWDTNEMTPVLRVNPFAYEGGNRVASSSRFRSSRGGGTFMALIGNESTEATASGSNNNMALSCMDLSSAMPNLVATGSLRSALVKLVDIRTGAASHTLTGHGIGGSNCGLASLQWSPTAPHVLASGCTMGTIRLWDIRKAGRNSWLMACLDPEQPAPSIHISHAYYPDLSHLKQRQHTKSKSTTAKGTKSSLSSTTAIQRGPNDYSMSAKEALVRSHEGGVDALAFDPSGQYLVSHGHGDISLKMWDLRDAGQLIPRRYLVSARRSRNTKLRVTQPNHRSDSAVIWVTQDTGLSAFVLHPGSSGGEGGTAKYQLNGHLKPIRDFFALPTDASLQGEVLTSAADGLILVWEPNIVKQANEKEVADRHSFSSSSQRKRQRATAQVDEDSW